MANIILAPFVLKLQKMRVSTPSHNRDLDRFEMELSNLVTTPFLSTQEFQSEASHHFCFPYASLPLLFCHGECITLNDVTFTQTKLETNIAVYGPDRLELIIFDITE